MRRDNQPYLGFESPWAMAQYIFGLHGAPNFVHQTEPAVSVSWGDPVAGLSRKFSAHFDASDRHVYAIIIEGRSANGSLDRRWNHPTRANIDEALAVLFEGVTE